MFQLRGLFAAIAAPLAGAVLVVPHISVLGDYDAFRAAHRGRFSFDRAPDGVSDEQRLRQFHEYSEMVRAHNARPDVSCTLEVNRFADYTETELQSTLGYQRSAVWQAASGGSSSSFLEADGDGNKQRGWDERDNNLVESFDWRGRLKSAGFIKDQGRCGSCWAVATVGVLELHAELGGSEPRPLSYKQIVNCMPNEHHCGGDGGCKGATGELALAWVQRYGLASEAEYQGNYGEKCMQMKPTIRIGGFKRLQTNRYLPLLRTVATVGPVLGSVAAIKPFHAYKEGVFAACQPNTVVNHAVVIVGYGYSRRYKKLYWTLRNSWAEGWGEGGYMRMERHEWKNERESDPASFCGVDNKPQDGVGCDGGPEKITVCGMCGILSDSAYPFHVRPWAGA